MRVKTLARPLTIVFTLICFAFLMHVSTVPLRSMAVTGGESVVVAGADQPGAIEQSAPSGAVQKKSPLLPIIIGVVVVGAVAAVLILVVFKTKYDILGTWYYDSTTNNHERDLTIIFSGTKKSGTLTTSGDGDYLGTFAVDGKDVTIHIMPDWGNIDFLGSFSNKDFITGTVSGFCEWCVEAFTGTAILTRTATAATVTPIITASSPRTHQHH